jgi:hypothetical protein
MRAEIGGNTMERRILGTVAWGLACAMLLATPALAQSAGNAPKRVPAGKTSALGGFFNCFRSMPNDVQGTATNGRVTTRLETRNHCGNPAQPVVVVLYTPNPGFRGQDMVYLNRSGGTLQQPLIVE